MLSLVQKKTILEASSTAKTKHLNTSIRKVNGFSFEKRRSNKMAQKVAKVGVKKQAGYLYFVDRQGDVSCAKMARGKGKKAGAVKKVAKVGVKKKGGFLYFIDKQGDISCAKMVRGGAKRKKKAKKAKKKAVKKKAKKKVAKKAKKAKKKAKKK